MAVSSFIPQLWSEQLLQDIEERLVGMSFVNHDYEGEIQQKGDTVVVNALGDVTIDDYDEETGLGDPEELSTSAQNLNIDRAKSFNFIVKSIERAQAAGDLYNAGTDKASKKMAKVVDKDIFATIAESASPANTIGTNQNPVEVTKDNAYDLIVDLRTALAEVGEIEDLRIAVPPKYYGLLLKDDRFVKAGTPQGEERLATGLIGYVDGFEVFETKNLPVTAVPESAEGAGDGYSVGHVVATSPMATSFAQQIVETETVKSPKFFGDVVRGLSVYGIKTFYPQAVAVLKFKIV